MILIDTVSRRHACNSCTHEFKKGDTAAYFYIRGERRSVCSKCLLKATVQLIQNTKGIATGNDLMEKELKLFKEAFVEAAI